MATYIKTVFTESQAFQVLTIPETQAEKIIRLNPHLSQQQMTESLRRNADLSLSTISYNLSTNIAVIWAHHSKLPIDELKKAIMRIAKLLPYIEISAESARRLKALCRVAGVPPVKVKV